MTGRPVEPSPQILSGRLDELYRLHHLDMLRLAYLICGDRPLAEDLVQEAFVRVASRFVELRNPDAFGPYLRRTLINLCRKQFRRKRVERAYLEREVRQPSSPAAVQPDVANKEAVREGLSRLTPRQRAAIVLRYYGDLSEREISERLVCRPSTVRSLIARGMQTLRAEIGSEVDA
jgi:RNA polymerase sigma-70 factor (sigma-E family)